jgi:Ras-related protein Rab-7A
LVYDITNARTFETLSNWRSEFLRQAGPKNPETFPFIVIGNKADKAVERKVQAAKVLNWCKQNGNIPHFEASAKDETNVNEVFENSARLAIKNQSTAT